MNYASEFCEIQTALTNNASLRKRTVDLIKIKQIHNPTIEEEDRLKIFRDILVDFVTGEILSLDFTYARVEQKLPKIESKYAKDNKIFTKHWKEHLVKTQLSRFYNHAVLEELAENNYKECFIPPAESAFHNYACMHSTNAKCDVQELLQNIIDHYELNKENIHLILPEHPDCAHVVAPAHGIKQI
ncbi:MAG: hypothetical protein ACP5N2_04075 [Candidatus Nanoarchaeia archaeon]